MLERGDLVPHFAVTRVDGTAFRYADAWQRRNLVLVLVPSASGADGAEAALGGDADGYARFAAAVRSLAGELVVTSNEVPGAPVPGVIVADRWGEIYVVATAPGAGDLPGPAAILEWLEHIQHECPECQGEAR
jgi:hypothetical protein